MKAAIVAAAIGGCLAVAGMAENREGEATMTGGYVRRAGFRDPEGVLDSLRPLFLSLPRRLRSSKRRELRFASKGE
jgi:hypothetical protein